MRDIRRNKEYFNTYLDYQYSRIEKKIAKLREYKDDEEKKQRILLSMTGYQVDLLKAEFSNGASKDKLKMLLISAIDVIKEYKNTTKDDILVILALAIMLDAEKEAEKFVVANKQVIAEDRLLDCFSEYIKTGKCEWNETLKLSNEYVELNKVFNSMNKEIALKNYLKEWYNNHREYAWYGSDIRDTDIYCGYWSFESAAIAKMLELNEMELEKCEYYPKI